MSDWKNVQYKDGKMRTGEGGGGGGSSTFAGLDDVSFNNIQNGQVPKYNSTTQKWENADESGGGSVNDVTLDGNSVVNGQGTAVLTTPTVNDLKDTNISSPSSGQTLQYNATNQKWENVTPASGGNVDDVKVNGTSVVTNKVANITSYKEITLAEYQALPSSKLTDNILYCIKDSAGADGFPPLIYSDEEREVGVWRDGKPLYQKTIDCGSLKNGGSKNVAHNISNLDFIAFAHGTYKNESGNFSVIPLVQSGSLVSYQIKIEVTTSNIKLQVDSGIVFDLEQIYVTIQYTKTTDTAGSGTWTTQGGYAHHYSTSEKVVGTWIDGKPLYEKTIHKSNQQSTFSDYVTIESISNAEFKNVYGIAKRIVNSTHTLIYPLATRPEDNNSYYILVRSFDDAVQYRIGEYGTQITDLWVTVQYTKTTD